MYNHLASQTHPTGVTTSTSAQVNQAGQGPVRYSPMPERSTSSGPFSTRESDAHENDVFDRGFMGGDDPYNNREFSNSLGQSPSDSSFHTGWDTHDRVQPIGRTPSAGSSRRSIDHTAQTQASDMMSGEATGGEHTLSMPYPRQPSQYSRVYQTQYRGPYHPYQPTQGPWDEPPHIQDSDSSLRSSRRNERASQGHYRTSHSPQSRTGRLGAPFHSQSPDPIHASIGQIALDVKRISAQITHLVQADEEHTRNMDRILGRLDSMGARLSALEDGVADVGGVREKKSGGTSRGGSNNHPLLKPVVHSMFYEMCGVEMCGNKTQRTQELCAVKPLENGAAFEVVNSREIWHPVWDARIDHIVNSQFLRAVVERIWNNEQSLRNTKGKGELDDTDFSMSVIADSAKIYFRNLHKQSDLLSKPDKLEKTRDKGRSRGRRQGRTKVRRQAAEQYCPELEIPLDEAMTALDTDYASEAYTCSSDDETSSEPGENRGDRREEWIATRREKAGLGVTAKMVVGPVWRNVDYIAFARWLTFKSHKGKESGNRPELTSEPLRKKRRTTVTTDIWKGFKKEFDPPPSKLSNRLPSAKDAPFKTMMANWWLRDHPGFKTLNSGGDWLKGFRNRLKRDDLHPLDWDHLNELEAWHKEKEREVRDESTSQFVVGSSAQ